MIQTQLNNIDPIEAWILATRPKTLPAAVAPVMVGSAMAFAHKSFTLLPGTAALAVALLLQIGVNLANDYFDYIKGIDSDERLGPVRVNPHHPAYNRWAHAESHAGVNSKTGISFQFASVHRNYHAMN